MGVWIEMVESATVFFSHSVTPRMGVWIEIFVATKLPKQAAPVTPRMGVWIEILMPRA